MDKLMIIRTLLLLLALLNQILVMAGYSPLPFDDEELERGLSSTFIVLTSLWAWWKNNDVTKKARSNKKLLDEINK